MATAAAVRRCGATMQLCETPIATVRPPRPGSHVLLYGPMAPWLSKGGRGAPRGPGGKEALSKLPRIGGAQRDGGGGGGSMSARGAGPRNRRQRSASRASLLALLTRLNCSLCMCRIASAQATPRGVPKRCG